MPNESGSAFQPAPTPPAPEAPVMKPHPDNVGPTTPGGKPACYEEE